MRLPVTGCGPRLRVAMVAGLLAAALSGCHYAVSQSYGLGYHDAGYGSGYYGHILYRFGDYGDRHYGHKGRYKDRHHGHEYRPHRFREGHHRYRGHRFGHRRQHGRRHR